VHVLLHRNDDGRCISFFGDLHPSFFGNVVKAMGRRSRAIPWSLRVLDTARRRAIRSASISSRAADALLRATVVRSDPPHAHHRRGRAARARSRRAISSPASSIACRTSRRWRRWSTARAAMEGLALTGAWVDPERGLVSTIVLEMGGVRSSARCCSPASP
jgi:hypothetical protein